MTHIVNDVIGKYLKGLGENLIDIERIKKQFEELGLKYDEELSKLRESIRQFSVPIILIKDNEFIIRCYESYIKKNTSFEKFEAIITEEQFIRALWNQKEKQMTCFSIDSKPKVLRPMSYSCDNCGYNDCIMKIRLWLWAWNKPFVMTLRPDVMINWDAHKLKCFNGSLPLIAVNTVFSASEGKVIVDIHGTANKETLVKAVIASRTELSGLMCEVTNKDFPEFNR